MLAERKMGIEELSQRERKLLKMIRETRHGEMRLVFQDGQVVRVEEWKESIKL